MIKKILSILKRPAPVIIERPAVRASGKVARKQNTIKRGR